MAWNEPGGSKDKDPWGRQDSEQSPPDLDEVIRKMQEKLSGIFGKKGSGGGGGKGRGGGVPGALLVVGILLVVFWIFQCFYIVQPAERGVKLRFGRYVETTLPGLHFLWFPIERVEKVNVDHIRTAELGYRSGSPVQRPRETVPEEALMLTQDENIVDIKFAVQYKIKDAADYLFRVREPDKTLHQATESAVREVVGKSTMDFVLTEGRSEIALRVQELIQQILDRYATGLQVTSVNMQDAQPPDQVQAAFDDAVKAREDEVRFRNEAEAYANDILPKARGNAARQLEEALAYKEQVIARAQGEASRFSQILEEYEKAPEVTAQRLYLETMEDVLGGSQNIVVDLGDGNNLTLLPLNQLLQQGSGNKTQASQNNAGGSSAFAPVMPSNETRGDRPSGTALRESIRGRERR